MKPHPKAREWQHRLLIFVAALLAIETITGLAIYLLPFSISNQFMVVLHTGLGLLFVAPFAWYQIRHWKIYRKTPLTHIKLSGYFSMTTVAVAGVSGLVLTYQALFQTRITPFWDTLHLVSTFALIAAVAPHIVIIALRNLRAHKTETVQSIVAAQKRWGIQISLLTAIAFAGLAIAVLAYEPTPLNNELPDDYNYLYGEDRPFYPSLAKTESGGAYDALSMSGSATCGRSGCHSEIYEEWNVSAHRYSAMDAAFLKVQDVMAEQNGPETTRYCGGCHDPISLFSGAKNVFTDDLTNLTGYQEGVSCIVCHSIQETDIQGNADYVVTQPERYVFELEEGNTAQLVSDFLIRAYPEKHIESLQHKLFKSPEFCAACHKQFIDEEINNVGWVQLQNQYDNWRKSRWNEPGHPENTIECRECHMPLTESLDPSAGDDLDYNRTPDDGKHRNHRFLAANQFMPLALDLEGAEEHVALTEKWLQGKIEIPEISDKWQPGPAVPVELVVPDTVAPGDPVKIEALITNNKVGHDFPTGPLDIIQAWVEVEVSDQAGNLIYKSGERDDKHFIEPGAFMFKAEPVDQYGNLIDRHNLWEMVGVRYRRALFPGFSDRAAYMFSCPATVDVEGIEKEELSLDERLELDAPRESVTALHVSARLLYRKADQFLLNFLFGEDSGITAPITVLSEDEKTIIVTGTD